MILVLILLLLALCELLPPSPWVPGWLGCREIGCVEQVWGKEEGY